MEADKNRILREVLGSYYISGQEMMFECPKCDHHKKKLSVNLEKNVFKCWVCDYSGTNLTYLIRRHGTWQNREDWLVYDGRVNIEEFDKIFAQTPQLQESITLSLPDEFISLASPNLTKAGLNAREYLSGRQIDLEDILKWRIGYCPTGDYSGRIIIPSFNLSGNVNYYVARTFKDDWPKYKNPPVSRDVIFNELFIDWSKDLIVVEGVFDAIVAGNAVPLLGSTLNERSKLFLEIIKKRPNVYFALDRDASKKQDKMIKKFLQYDVPVYAISIGNFDDVGSMTKEQFEEYMKKATFIESDDYLLYQTLTL